MYILHPVITLDRGSQTFSTQLRQIIIQIIIKLFFSVGFFFGFFQGADRILFFYSFALSRPLTRQCNENHFIRSKLFSR